MKKILLILLINLVVASCVDDTSNLYTRSGNITFSVDEAKAAFEKEAEALEIRPFTTSTTTRNNKEKPVITPLWKNGEAFSSEEGAFAVVPLNIPLTMVFARGQENTQLSDDEKYSNTNIRLLIQKKAENEYIYTIVHITGDFSYIIERHRNVKSQKLNKTDNFSGEIRYFTLKGELLWGEIYRDGRKAGTIVAVDTSSGSNIQKVQTRGYETRCESHLIEYETCYYTGYDLGEGMVETGVECYYDYSWEDYCYEEWVPDEYGCPTCGSPTCNGGCQSGGIGTGQGGTGKVVNKVHNAKITDVMADQRLLTVRRKTQIGNTCVPTILNFLLKIKGSNLGMKDIIKCYKEIGLKKGVKLDIHLSGIPSDYVIPGAVILLGTDVIFATNQGKPFLDYKAAIDKGNVVMTNIFETINGRKFGHNLLIIGYTEDGNLIYIDPRYTNDEYECSSDYIEVKDTSKYDIEIKL